MYLNPAPAKVTWYETGAVTAVTCPGSHCEVPA